MPHDIFHEGEGFALNLEKSGRLRVATVWKDSQGQRRARQERMEHTDLHDNRWRLWSVG